MYLLDSLIHRKKEIKNFSRFDVKEWLYKCEPKAEKFLLDKIYMC